MRRLAIALGAIVLVLLMLAGVAYAMLDADLLKGQAVAYVKEQTGWDLSIEGPVNLSFFPWLGAEMQQVTMRSPDGPKGPDAQFDSLALNVRLVPLLSRTIEVGGVAAAGGLVRMPGDRGAVYELRNLEVQTGAFGGSEPTDLSISFDAVGGGVQMPVSLTSRLLLDLPRDVTELSGLKLRAGNSSLEGRLRGTKVFEAPAWEAELTSDLIDLDQLLPILAASSSSSASGARQARATPPPTAHAVLKVKELRAYGLRFSSVETTVDSSRGIVTAKPARANGYGGAADFVVSLDGRSAEPALQAKGRLTRVNLEPLLRDLRQFENFSGTGDVSLDLSARGTGADRVVRTLDGTASVSITDGRIQGVDFLKLIQQARQLADRLRGREADGAASSEDFTSFSRFAASARISDGIARTEDIVLESPSLGLTGRGTIDLNAGTLDIVVRATSPNIDTVVPVHISGPIGSPRYRLQAGTILKEEALEELQRQLKRRGLGSLFKKPIKD